MLRDRRSLRARSEPPAALRIKEVGLLGARAQPDLLPRRKIVPVAEDGRDLLLAEP